MQWCRPGDRFDEVVLDGDTRITVLAVGREDVLLGVTAPAAARVLASDVPEPHTPRWAARNTPPGNN